MRSQSVITNNVLLDYVSVDNSTKNRFLCFILLATSYCFLRYLNRISGVTVSVFTTSAVDCGFQPRSGQT